MEKNCEVPGLDNKLTWMGVDSSALAAVAYDKPSKTLFVLFRNGSIYSYEYVTEYRYSQLLQAESIGKYFNKFIKEKAPVWTEYPPERGGLQ